MLAIVQSFLHIYYDYDEVILPTQKIRNPTSIKDPHRAISPLMQLRKTIPSLWQGAVARTCATSLLGPVFYAVFIRRTAWTWTLYFARLVWDVPRASEPARIPPYHISLILRSATSGFLLITLWELSNAVFTSYVSQEPLKGGNPLTDDSGDPNGSLLNGLKAKKELSKVSFFNQMFSHILMRLCRNSRSGNSAISVRFPLSDESPSSPILTALAGQCGRK